MAGNKNSGRKTKRFEFEINRLKELSLKRAIKILEQKETDDEKLNRVLNSDQQEITLKVIDKALGQEVKLSSMVPTYSKATSRIWKRQKKYSQRMDGFNLET
jgi:hypothetical protein